MRESSLAIVMTLIVFLACGCATAPEILPFPPVGPMSPRQQIDLVRSRAHSVRTATAVVQVAMESEKYSGTFDLVSIFERPGRLHLLAYKSVLLSTYSIFELTFTAERYHLRVYPEDEEPEEFDGSLAEFPADHPDLASLHWTREVLFLPGDFDGELSVPDTADRVTSFRGATRQGAGVVYELDPSTLAVLGAEVSPPGDATRYQIRYRSYRDVGDAIVPHRVLLEESNGPFRLEAEIVDIEVNGEVDPSVFEIPQTQ